MKPLRSTLLALSALLLASPAMAQVAGAWRVTGKVAGRAFAVDCRFEPRGTEQHGAEQHGPEQHGAAEFGGVCVDAETGEAGAHPGKAHTLSKGVITGRQVRWTYPANFLLAKFDVTYTGTLDGDRMTGVISAGGRDGQFTAARK
jgi:hypothetical protein